jgi:hypothetical protein
VTIDGVCRRLGRPQSRSVRYEDEKNHFSFGYSRIQVMDTLRGDIREYLGVPRALTEIFIVEETKLNSVVLVRKRTIPTERPPLSAK